MINFFRKILILVGAAQFLFFAGLSSATATTTTTGTPVLAVVAARDYFERVVNHVDLDSTGGRRLVVAAHLFSFEARAQPVDVYVGVSGPGQSSLDSWQPTTVGGAVVLATLQPGWQPLTRQMALTAGETVSPSGEWLLAADAPRGLYTLLVVAVPSGADANDPTLWLTHAARLIWVR